jgi:hypothetical protein
MDDPRLLARYGDFNLGLTFGSRVVRRDIHKALAAKGLSVRQIAASTGASKDTVNRDLNPAIDPHPEREAVSRETPAERKPVSPETPVEVDEVEVEDDDVTEVPFGGGMDGFVASDDDEATTYDSAAISAALAPVEPVAPPAERPELTALVKSVTKRNPLTEHELNRLRSLIPLRP